MTSPGGQEVGRISLRVVPDVSRFKDDVERKLRNLKAEVKLTVELNKASVQKAKRTLNQALSPVRVSVEMNRASITRAKQQIQDIAGKIKVDADVDSAELAREVSAATRRVSQDAKVEVKVDVDRDSINRTSGLLSRMFRGFMEGVTEVAGVAGKVSEGILAMGGAAMGMGGAFARMGSSVTGAAAGLTIMAGLASVVASALGLLAGAVMAAGGAIGAAFAGAPALLSALLIPIGAIALGMDGIKRAMEPINDELETLKTGVEGVFEQGLRPVFEELQTVMPAVQTGMMGVSAALVTMAQAMVPILTSPEGIRAIQSAFAGVNYIIVATTDPAKRLLAELLKIAGTTELYMILGDAIAGITDRMAGFLARVTEVNNGTSLLSSTMEGLFGILDKATMALLAFMEAGMEFLGAAAPGLEDFFSGMTAMFENIDWAGLGDSFGRIFAAIGEGMAAVPPETWERLEEAVAGFATAIEEMIASGAMDSLIGLFASLIDMAPGFIDAIIRATAAIAAMDALLRGDFQQAEQMFALAMDGIRESADSAKDDVPPKLGELGTNSVISLQTALAPMPGAAGAIVQQATAAMQAGFAPAPGIVGGLAADVTKGVAANLAPMPPDAEADALATAGNLITGIKSAHGPVGAAARANADSVNRGHETGIQPARNTGDAMGRGIWERLSSWAGALLSKATSMVTDAWNAAMSAIGAHSPSRLFGETGRAMVEGIIVGLRTTAPHLYDRLREILRRLYERAQAFITTHTAEAEVTLGNLRLAGRDAIQDWISGIESQRPALADAVRRLSDLIRRGMEAGWTPEQWRAEFLAERERWRLQHQRGGGTVSGDVYRVEPAYREVPTASEIAEALAGAEFVIDSRGGEILARWVRKENSLAEARI